MRNGKRTLLFAENELAAEIAPLASEWVGSWLIDPFILVPVPSQPTGSPLVTRMPGTVIGRDGVREIDVFDLLSQGEYELIRFLTLQAVEPGRVQLDRQALLEYAMSLQQASSPATRFWRLNLMVFPTAVTPEQPFERLVQGWEANVIAAPENRSSDRSFDAFVVTEGRRDYVGHLLGNAATAGAMWCGMDAGPYDQTTPSGGAATLVALQRTFVRAVVMDDFLVRIARSGLDRLIADESPFNDPILMAGGHLVAHQVVPEADLGRAIDVMVDVMMKAPPSDALSYKMRDHGLPVMVEQRRIGVGEALLSFGRFSLDKLITVPRFLIFRGQQRIAARFTQALHGDEGDARVELGRDPIGDLSVFVRDLQNAQHEKSEVLVQLERNLVDIDFSDAEYRELWAAMRSVTFAMYDGQMGSARPGSIQEQLRDEFVQAGFELPGAEAASGEAMQKSLVMPTKSSLFPDWRDSHRVSDDLAALLEDDMAHLSSAVGWLDIDNADALKAAIDRRGDALKRAVEVADERRTELLTDLGRDLQRHGELELAQGQINDWIRSTEGREVSRAAVDRLRRALARLPGSVVRLAQEAEASVLGVDELLAMPDSASAADHVAEDAEDVKDVEGEGDVDAAELTDDDDADALPAPDPMGRYDFAAESQEEFEPVAGVEGTVGASASVKKRPWWARFAFWGRRLVTVKRAFAFSADQASDIAATLAMRLEDELALLDEEIEGLRRAEEELELEIEDLAGRVQSLDEAAKPFRDWFTRNARSFAWGLFDRMRSERRALARHLESTRDWLALPLPVSPEEAILLYERFVRRLRLLFTWGLLIPGFVFLLVRTILSEAALRFGDWITSGRIGEFIKTDVGRVLAGAVRTFLGNPWPYLVSFVLIGTLSAFIHYYRDWSQRQRKIRQLRSDIGHMRQWVQDLKEERSRLQQLERHSADVLTLMSEVLHRPFVIPSEPIRGRRSGSVGGEESTMSLSVAEPLWDAHWQGQHAFEAQIVAQHARRGWLEDAYRQLATTVEEVTGQPYGSFSVERLESSARTRRALMHLLDQRDNDPRLLIGQRREREVLREMISWKLSEDLPFPMVAETRVPPTSGVDVRLDLLDDERDGVHPWVDFMLHGLPSGQADEVADQWAPWTISVAAGDEVRAGLRTVVHGPMRYRARVEERRPGSFIPLRDGEIRPVELVIRVDFAMDRTLEDIRGCEQVGSDAGSPREDFTAARTVPQLEDDLDV